MSTAILLSGGMDSTSIAYWKRPSTAMTIDYGQKPAAAEIRAAAAVCKDLKIEHQIIRVDLASLGSGDMAGTPALALAPVSEWWPFRNQMLITIAAMHGVAAGITTLMVGTLKADGAHADGTQAFLDAMDQVLKIQEGGIRLEAPAIALDGAELVRASKIPMEILGWAHSCHVANQACGVCRGCRKHYETMAELGLDPY